MSGHWLLVVDKQNPNKLQHMWIGVDHLQELGVEPRIGDIFRLDQSDPTSEYRILGTLGGRVEELLDTIVNLIDVVDPAGTTSQDLRFNIMQDLVDMVQEAASRLHEVKV